MIGLLLNILLIPFLIWVAYLILYFCGWVWLIAFFVPAVLFKDGLWPTPVAIVLFLMLLLLCVFANKKELKTYYRWQRKRFYLFKKKFKG